MLRKLIFFVICGDNIDKQPIVINGLIIEPCDQYIYLGSPFTSDGSISTTIKTHAQSKICCIMKFMSFLSKNNDIPFSVKRKVFDADLILTILYGCESWVGNDLKPIIKLYRWSVKQQLGVRKSTCDNLSLVKLGYPSLKAFVTSKKRKFFSKMWQERSAMRDDPLIHAITVIRNYDVPVKRILDSFLFDDIDDVQLDLDNIKDNVCNSDSSRIQFHKSINPDCNVHPIYSSNIKVNELERISWTQMRVSAHSLAIESGRWN